MRSRTLGAAILVLLCATGSARAQDLSLEFHDGRVRLAAENVPVARILAEWTRIGGTRIVNGERIPGAPLTIRLENMPEQKAVEVLLRDAAGYMVLARDTITPGASTLDKILILPTTTGAPAAAAVPPPVQPRFPPPERIEPPEDDTDSNQLDPPETPAPRPAFPRGRVPPAGLNLPSGPPTQAPQSEDDQEPPNPSPVPPMPGNPFGVPAGSSQPGVINPPPPPDPDDQRPN